MLNTRETISSQEKIPFHKIDLKLSEEDSFHQNGIDFEEKDVYLVAAYNLAIQEICTEEEFGIFHQCSPNGNPNKPGYHFWESLRSVSKEKMLSVIPQIHIVAERKYQDLDLELVDYLANN